MNQSVIQIAAAFFISGGLVTPAIGQSRFLLNDRANDRVAFIGDLGGNGEIDDANEIWTWFDAANDAGTLPVGNPTAMASSPLGWVLLGDQSNRVIFLLRDITGDGTAQQAGESVVFVDQDNTSGASVAFPTGAAFDNQGRFYIGNAGNAFGPDAIYRLTDLDGDGTANGPGEIEVYVGEGAFGPGNGDYVPYQMVFDADGVGYVRNTGSASLGLLGVYRFEDANGNGRADDPGEFTAFFSDANQSGITLGPGFPLEIDRARSDCFYTMSTLSGPTYQLIRMCDLNGDQSADGPGEGLIVWETNESGFSPIDIVSLEGGDLLITDNSAGSGTAREIILLQDLDADGTFMGKGERTSWYPNEAGTLGNVREMKIVPRFGDLSGDEIINVFDLLILLGNWGQCGNFYHCPGDLNGDGMVNVFDLLLMLGEWG